MFDIKNFNLDKEIASIEMPQIKQIALDIKSVLNYIQDEEGEEGIKQITDKLKEHGFAYPDWKLINTTKWISVKAVIIALLAAAKLFNWDDKDIIKAGKEVMVMGTLKKGILRYLISPKYTFNRFNDVWRKRFSEGEIKIVSYDDNSKIAALKIVNFKTHPILCFLHIGIYTRAIEFTTGSENVSVKKVKCTHWGDTCHEYKITW
ncbi:MAG: hypothetical protein ABIE43_02160 [Patescibacteria group bacterium]